MRPEGDNGGQSSCPILYVAPLERSLTTFSLRCCPEGKDNVVVLSPEGSYYTPGGGKAVALRAKRRLYVAPLFCFGPSGPQLVFPSGQRFRPLGEPKGVKPFGRTGGGKAHSCPIRGKATTTALSYVVASPTGLATRQLPPKGEQRAQPLLLPTGLPL